MATLKEVHAGGCAARRTNSVCLAQRGQIPDRWWELNSVEEIVRIKQSHRSIPELYEQPNWWSDEWIPVGSDFDGNFLCVDMKGCFGGKPGQVLVFMHDEPERKVLVDPQVVAVMDKRLTQNILEPGTAACWNSIKVAYDDDFVQHVDDLLRNAGDTGSVTATIPWFKTDRDSEDSFSRE